MWRSWLIGQMRKAFFRHEDRKHPISTEFRIERGRFGISTKNGIDSVMEAENLEISLEFLPIGDLEGQSSFSRRYTRILLRFIPSTYDQASPATARA